MLVRRDDRLAQVAQRGRQPLLILLHRPLGGLTLLLDFDIIQRERHVSGDFLQQQQFFLIRGHMRRQRDEERAVHLVGMGELHGDSRRFNAPIAQAASRVIFERFF